MNCRFVMANLVGGAIAAGMLPIGCSGTQEEARFVLYEPAPRTVTASVRSIEVPAVTAREMKACVDAMNHPWTEPSHAFQYHLGATDQGRVFVVNLRDSTLRDAALEACFKRALAAMEVPKDALRLRSSKPVSGGESQSPGGSYVGIVQAVAAPIAFAPIVIPALGVTIIVAISLDIIRKATSEPDCKEVKEDCIVVCNGRLPTPDFGFKFWNCVNRCMRTAGC